MTILSCQCLQALAWTPTKVFIFLTCTTVFMIVNIALLTVTDTRTIDNDKSGAILVSKIAEANHKLIDRKICKDIKHVIFYGGDDHVINYKHFLKKYFQ